MNVPYVILWDRIVSCLAPLQLHHLLSPRLQDEEDLELKGQLLALELKAVEIRTEQLRTAARLKRAKTKAAALNPGLEQLAIETAADPGTQGAQSHAAVARRPDRIHSRTCSPNRKRGRSLSRSRSRSPMRCSKRSAAQPAPDVPLQHPLPPPQPSQCRRKQEGCQADLGRILLPVKEEPGLTAAPAPVSPASGNPASFTATQLRRREQRMSLFSDRPAPVSSHLEYGAAALPASCDAHDHAGVLARNDTCDHPIEAVHQVSGGGHSPAQSHGAVAAAIAADTTAGATVANSRQLPASSTKELASLPHPQPSPLAEFQAQPQPQLRLQQPCYIAVRLTHDDSSWSVHDD